jgi:hypothetical protein
MWGDYHAPNGGSVTDFMVVRPQKGSLFCCGGVRQKVAHRVMSRQRSKRSLSGGIVLQNSTVFVQLSWVIDLSGYALRAFGGAFDVYSRASATPHR